MNKVSKEFVGVCELRQLQHNTFFRVIDNKGNISKNTYIYCNGDYNKSIKKYECSNYDNGNYKTFKGTQKVTTDFIY